MVFRFGLVFVQLTLSVTIVKRGMDGQRGSIPMYKRTQGGRVILAEDRSHPWLVRLDVLNKVMPEEAELCHS